MLKINRYFHLLYKLFERRKIVFFLILIVLLGLVGFALFFGNGSAPEVVSFSSNDLVRVVKISGKVVPQERIDLGFEIAGTMSAVGPDVGSQVSKGEVLAKLDSSSISAEIRQAEAELASVEAELNKLEGVETYESTIANAKRSINQAIRDAYTAASDSVYNKSDQVFIDPRTGRSNSYNIAGVFDDFNGLRDSVNTGRVAVGVTLEKWEKIIASLGTTSYLDNELKLSKQYLSEVTAFISNVSRAVNMFEVSDSMSQTQIDQYKVDMLAARDGLNKASQRFIDAESNLTKLLSDVPVQLAKVEAAKANILNLRSKLSKYTLTAPISGVVSKQDAKFGQAVSVGTNLVSVISANNIIETFVPEVSIAGIEVGNSARVTLDAYGQEQMFAAKVVHIDPAETIRDGVSTYKVKLSFEESDQRIRSGMTANIEIETFRKGNTLVIPERTLVREDGSTFVYILDGKGESRKVQVTLGERDFRGNVEVVSGLSPEDKVLVTPPEEK